MAEPTLAYSDFVKLVLAALNAAEIPYMIGGAVAAWAWGEPRATRDLDVVVQVPIEAVNRLSEELTARDILVPPDIILNQLLEDRADIPINAIHMHSGYKADIYLTREGDALRKEAFRRRKQVDLGPEIGNVYLHTPEDLIIYKLWYYSLSQQTKHLRDITAIVNTLGNELDQIYIRRWAEEKEILTLWNELSGQIKPDK
ncbi:MAG: hypothetical protein ISR58_05370 [Anaerolineales bacterium]|nr:hypothetical protein [Chloroflexota bacterium]MBL6980604.1 hypothetical protein [Anaerolineales bacterium]